jgi:phage/conjugal plasmid C-4 type zinc finger TraR family protein
MDEIDRAQERTAAYLEKCIAAARGIPPSAGAKSDFCEDCGDEIPEARRLASPEATRCIRCQARHERKW